MNNGEGCKSFSGETMERKDDLFFRKEGAGLQESVISVVCSCCRGSVIVKMARHEAYLGGILTSKAREISSSWRGPRSDI